MSVEQWVALGGLALTVIGWFIRLERRLGAVMTRDEHEKICDRRQDELREILDEIRSTVHGFAEESKRHRERVNERLGDIRTQIAVLRERQGDDAFDDAGRYRRRPSNDDE